MHSVPPHRITPYSLPPGDDKGLLFQEEETVNLRDYWIVILKYRWTVAIFCLSIVIIAVLSVQGEVNTYTATATLYLENQTPNIMGVMGVSSAFTPAANALDYYETQRTLLTSRSLTAQVIQELGLDRGPRFGTYMEARPSSIKGYASIGALREGVQGLVQWLLERFKGLGKEGQEAQEAEEQAEEQTETFEFGVRPGLINRYLARLAINNLRQTQLISVSFTSLNPSFSKEVANAHATAFIRTSLLTRFELTTEAREFLAERLAELKARLEKSEEKLNRFQKTHAIMPLEKGESLVVERLRGLNTDLTQARSKRIELESLYRDVQKGDNRFLSQIIDNPVVRQIKDQVATLEVEKGRLATTFRPTFPGVTALQEQIDHAQNRVNQEVNRIVRTITADYHTAKAREQALNQAMEEQRRAALDLREKAIEAAILEREVESDRTLYESVLRRSKETDLTGAMPISNIRMVDRADVPLSSDPTSGKRTILLSALAGLMGGIGIAFLRHYLDNTLKTPEDIGRSLHLPTLGVLPNMAHPERRAYALGFIKKLSLRPGALKGQQGEKSGPVTAHHPLSLASESYQAICTALLFSQPERAPRTILITSSQPQEGKTITAINVAITLARHGAPVLLIDADLRNGNCHRRLGVQNVSGLTNALTGNRDATEFIKETAMMNLSLLSRGAIPPNPAELLGSAKMRELLESLETSFAFIIIDSAPLLPITDSVLLSTKVDGVVLVAKGQAVSRYVVRQACERLAYVRAKILGVILNHIDLQSPEYKNYRQFYRSYYTAYTTDHEQ